MSKGYVVWNYQTISKWLWLAFLSLVQPLRSSFNISRFFTCWRLFTRGRWMSASSLPFLSFILPFALFVAFTLQPLSETAAQVEPTDTPFYGTNTPGGPTPTSGYVDLALTATANARTPDVKTVTPVGTPDRTGCPGEWLVPDGLDDDYVATCSRCILSGMPTTEAVIPGFIMATIPPLGSPPAAFPTIAPMYKTPTLGGLVAPPTYTPAPTATPDLFEWTQSFDFTESSFGWVTSGPSDIWGEYVEGQGFSQTYFSGSQPGYADRYNFLRVFWEPPHAIRLTEIRSTWVSINDYGVDDYESHYYVCDENCDDEFTPGAGVDLSTGTHTTINFVGDASGVGEIGLEAYAAANDFYLVAVQIKGIGTPPFVTDPTPTPPPTAAPTQKVVLCSSPIYKDLDTPIASVNVTTSTIGTDCYIVIPAINSEDWLLDVGLRGDELELCVEWLLIPSISILGVEVPVDMIFLVVIGYLVKRVWTF